MKIAFEITFFFELREKKFLMCFFISQFLPEKNNDLPCMKEA